MHHVRWIYEATEETDAVVPPDGCRDILVIARPGAPTQVSLTAIDFKARSVRLAAGTVIVGYRFRPGVLLDGRCIAAIAACPAQAEALVNEAAVLDNDAVTLVDALTVPESTVRAVAKSAGVTQRTLQRRFRTLGLPCPDFWRLLGRARLAAIALRDRTPLVEIALAHGYSDQPHMTRDFVEWFGKTPAEVRRDAKLLAGIRHAGLGNWTSEQSSMM